MCSGELLEEFVRKKTDARPKIERQVVFLVFEFARNLDESVLRIDLHLFGRALEVNRPWQPNRELMSRKINQHVVVPEHAGRNVDVGIHACRHYRSRLQW